MRIDPKIDKAMRLLDTMSLNREEREIYEAKLKWLRDEAGAIKKARAEGKEEGKVEMAHAMLQKGLTLDIIAEITGLSIEAIKKLTKDQK